MQLTLLTLVPSRRKNNFRKVPSNTEGTGAECPRWWFWRCLFSPEAALYTARKSAASLLTPLPTAAKLVQPSPSFLWTQGNISNLKRDNLIFPPRDFLWVLTTTGPVTVGPRTMWALRGKWHLLGGKKKKSFAYRGWILSTLKAKNSKGKKKPPHSLSFKVQSIFHVLTWNTVLLSESVTVQSKVHFL